MKKQKHRNEFAEAATWTAFKWAMIFGTFFVKNEWISGVCLFVCMFMIIGKLALIYGE